MAVRSEAHAVLSTPFEGLISHVNFLHLSWGSKNQYPLVFHVVTNPSPKQGHSITLMYVLMGLWSRATKGLGLIMSGLSSPFPSMAIV